MTAGQIITPHGGQHHVYRAALASAVLVGVVAVAIGAVANVAKPAPQGAVLQAMERPAAAVPGVARNNMSDAVRVATLDRAFPGVARNNMSDAVRVATLDRSVPGVAVNNMSDAARLAVLPRAVQGVAQNDMSDAVRAALLAGRTGETPTARYGTGGGGRIAY
jgi:hypothetical protein